MVGESVQAESAKRAWPPSKTHLEHLYLEKRLSARKIARLYGMKSANTVIRRLKQEGIARRNPAEIFRKATDELIDGWVRRYQGGESLEQIAGDTISPVTLYLYLRKRGVQLRTTGEARRAARVKRDRAVFGENEDEIRRLYLDQGLTCLQIARHYGLTCQSEAAAEARVYRRLKELGIELRQKGSLSRRYDHVAAEWARRYEAGESSIAIACGTTSSSVVAKYLDELGIKRRDGSQAHTKYRKTPFDGTEQDMAYLLGFTRGDVHARRNYRLVKLATASTHPAQLDLFTSLFAAYGPISIHPVVSKVAGFEWFITAAVDSTFEFLMLQKSADPCKIMGENSFLSYLAGLFDAEGSLWLTTDRRFSPYWSITNSDPRMLDWVTFILRKLGIHPSREPPTSQGVARVCLWRREEVAELLQMMPIRHPEKKAKARIVLDRTMQPSEKHTRWNRLMEDIRHERDEFIRAAERESASKGRGATNSVRGLMACLRYFSHWRRFPLDQSIRLETLNWLGEYVNA